MSNCRCPQCGCDGMTIEEFIEGVCADCCRENQNALDEYNAEHDRWQALSDQQRTDAIKRACSG